MLGRLRERAHARAASSRGPRHGRPDRAAGAPPGARTARRSRAGPGARRDPSSTVGAPSAAAGRAAGTARDPIRGMGFRSAERRRSRTDRAVGCTAALVLKTG
jgi:hypothetical protein